ncbi:protein phosphatase 2C [Nitzschia inconspicua]|uniref:Protein phosphatase 2C n=1 Tax=Nitzschia inconspicua TaxID=303405 RepID=A0A9K3LRN1_9STRA|nr:protein phosphatase 2C [Nitzschia inconspicua]
MHLHRLSLLVVVAVTSIVAIVSECPPHGCSLTAIDIAADGSEPEKEALAILRKSLLKTSSSDDHDDDNSSNTSHLLQNALETLSLAGDDSSVTMTLRGYKGGPPEAQINQDRAMLIRPFRISSTERQIAEKEPVAQQLLGVFDGHGTGGEQTSQHALEQVPQLLAEKLKAIAERDTDTPLHEQEEAVKQALVEVFLEVDQTDPTKGAAGCTATVILQLGPKLYIANAGDSISFVGVYVSKKDDSAGSNDANNGNTKERPLQQQVRIVYETREDKPDLPDEHARITAAGGHVNIPANPEVDVPRAYHVDKDGRLLWGLAMSRSLGDWAVQGVIAEPIVDVLDVFEIVQTAMAAHVETCEASITSDDDDADDKNKYCEALDPSQVHIFAVSATDGMMDELPSNYIGSIVARALFDRTIQLHPLSAAKHLILEAAKGWNRLYNGGYRDDIAIAAAIIYSDESILLSQSRNSNNLR